ncbi:MAG: hypothetical protein ACYSW8_12160, partial [Planctomycetota bacterium]
MKKKTLLTSILLSITVAALIGLSITGCSSQKESASRQHEDEQVTFANVDDVSSKSASEHEEASVIDEEERERSGYLRADEPDVSEPKVAVSDSPPNVAPPTKPDDSQVREHHKVFFYSSPQLAVPSEQESEADATGPAVGESWGVARDG